MQRILSEMSVLSQRKVLIRAQELVRTPEFRDVPAPTPEEVRKFLADKPRFQAKFPVPELPGRAQYGTRPLEILGADLIEKDQSTRAVKGNRLPGPGGKEELQTMILVIGDRFTRKCWATPLPDKETSDVLAGFRKLWPDIIKATAGSHTARATTKADTGPWQLEDQLLAGADSFLDVPLSVDVSESQLLRSVCGHRLRLTTGRSCAGLWDLYSSFATTGWRSVIGLPYMIE